jgi:hypothetical protein
MTSRFEVPERRSGPEVPITVGVTPEQRLASAPAAQLIEIAPTMRAMPPMIAVNLLLANTAFSFAPTSDGKQTK